MGQFGAPRSSWGAVRGQFWGCGWGAAVGRTRKKREEALGAAVDDIDLVQRHCVHHFLPLLQLSVGALHKFCLGGDTHTHKKKGVQSHPKTSPLPPKCPPSPTWEPMAS